MQSSLWSLQTPLRRSTAWLSPRQLADFQESLRAEGGALQYQAATADMLQAKGQGFQGRFASVDIYRSATLTMMALMTRVACGLAALLAGLLAPFRFRLGDYAVGGAMAGA